MFRVVIVVDVVVRRLARAAQQGVDVDASKRTIEECGDDDDDRPTDRLLPWRLRPIAFFRGDYDRPPSPVAVTTDRLLPWRLRRPPSPVAVTTDASSTVTSSRRRDERRVVA